MNKCELIQRIMDSRRQLERYLFYFEKTDSGDFIPSGRPKFSPAEMLEAGADGERSLKDLLTSQIAAEQDFLERLALARQGGAGALAGEGKGAALSELSVEQALERFACSYQQLLSELQATPEADFDLAGYGSPGDQTLGNAAGAVTRQRYDRLKQVVRRWRRSHAGEWKSKASIIADIRAERRQLERNLAEIPRQQMETPGVIGDWSVKDVLAHLVEWEQMFLGWYAGGLRGETPPTPAPGYTWRELDRLNRAIYEKHLARELDAVLKDFQDSYVQIQETVEAISEADLFTPGLYAWQGKGNLSGYVLANTAHHYRWAKTHLRKWKKRTQPEVV